MAGTEDLDVGFGEAGAALGVWHVMIEVKVVGAAALDALAAVAIPDGDFDSGGDLA